MAGNTFQVLSLAFSFNVQAIPSYNAATHSLKFCPLPTLFENACKLSVREFAGSVTFPPRATVGSPRERRLSTFTAYSTDRTSVTENKPTVSTTAADQKKVLVPIGMGTEEMEAAIIVDILRRAGAHVTMASVEPDLQINASRRVKLIADTSISTCEEETFDLVVLPVLVPVANGSEEMEVVIIIDVLRRANAEVVVASIEETLEIVASREVKIVADMLIEDAATTVYDLIILPVQCPVLLQHQSTILPSCVQKNHANRSNKTWLEEEE